MLHIYYNELLGNKINDKDFIKILYNTNWSESENDLDNTDNEQEEMIITYVQSNNNVPFSTDDVDERM